MDQIRSPHANVSTLAVVFVIELTTGALKLYHAIKGPCSILMLTISIVICDMLVDLVIVFISPSLLMKMNRSLKG